MYKDPDLRSSRLTGKKTGRVERFQKRMLEMNVDKGNEFFTGDLRDLHLFSLLRLNSINISSKDL